MSSIVTVSPSIRRGRKEGTDHKFNILKELDLIYGILGPYNHRNLGMKLEIPLDLTGTSITSE